ncbi:hypothetical protein [Paenarthrobacter sp. NPDC089316]|uniref:hypothetical protein n=1 Tax=unclassified Paenarthrobacter TaxID=2634190 RepID=UPI00344A783A
MLETTDYPTDTDVLKLIAYYQFPHIRDRLMADIPGINQPPEHILFAQTTQAPDWSRIEWAKQLLTHTYTLTAPQHAAPILTTIGYINWPGVTRRPQYQEQGRSQHLRGDQKPAAGRGRR